MADLPTILLVDDELAITELYSSFLSTHYDVITANDGEKAIEKIDDSVDAVILNRRMPNISGDEVLSQIRDRGIDCPVAFVTAVQPDLDIIDMDFDEYIVKPITRQDVGDLAAILVERAKMEDDFQHLFAVASKIAALRAHYAGEQIEEIDEFLALERHFEQLERRLMRSRDVPESAQFQDYQQELQFDVLLDSNIFIASLTNEPYRGEEATDFLNQNQNFSTSILNLMEIRTVLAKKKQIEGDRVERVLQDIVDQIPIYTPDSDDLAMAYELQQETLLYPMDCIFLSLAEDLDAYPVSFDGELIEHGAMAPTDFL